MFSSLPIYNKGYGFEGERCKRYSPNPRGTPKWARIYGQTFQSRRLVYYPLRQCHSSFLKAVREEAVGAF